MILMTKELPIADINCIEKENVCTVTWLATIGGEVIEASAIVPKNDVRTDLVQLQTIDEEIDRRFRIQKKIEREDPSFANSEEGQKRINALRTTIKHFERQRSEIILQKIMGDSKLRIQD